MGRRRAGLLRSTVLFVLLIVIWLAVGAIPPHAQEAPSTPTDASRTESVSPTGRYTEIRGFVDWFQRGGNFMYPLLLSSIVGIAVIIERFIAIRRATANTRTHVGSVLRALHEEGIDAARTRCRQIGNPASRILYSGLSRVREGPAHVEKAMEASGSIEVAFLQRGLLWLSTVANVTPLLGFLGTVSGMIHAFATIAGADQISARLVAGGIEEALITTEAGLSIAIPVQAFHNYFVGRIDRFITEMEEGSLDLAAALEEAGGKS